MNETDIFWNRVAEDPIPFLFCVSIIIILILWMLFILFLNSDPEKKGLFAVTHSTVIDEKIMDRFFKTCGLPVVYVSAKAGKDRRENRIWYLKSFIKLAKSNSITHIFSRRDIEGKWDKTSTIVKGFSFILNGIDIFIQKEKVIVGIKNRDLESELIN